MAAAASSSKNARGCDFIPEDVVFQILLHLPVESLLRFKAVSHSWRSLIESPEFVFQHAQRSDSENTCENKLVMLDMNCKRCISVIDLQWFNQVNFELNSHTLPNVVTLIGSFHGIVCLWLQLLFDGCDEDGTLVVDITAEHEDEPYLEVVSLWNPATKHVKILPPPRGVWLITSGGNYHISYGFGFDVKTRDYRVVRVIFDIDANDTFKSHVEIYSLKTNSWRVIDAAVPLRITTSFDAVGPLGKKKEVYYWLGIEDVSHEEVILSFDFSKEEFGILSLKEVRETVTRPVISSQILAILGEKLACIHWVAHPGRYSHCKVWVFDTCEGKESWTRLYTVTLKSEVCPLGFSANGKMLLKKRENGSDAKLLLFDPTSKILSETPCKGSFNEVAVYRESLVSVKGMDGETYRVDSKWKAKSSTWNLIVHQMILASMKEFAELLDINASCLIIFDEPKPVPNLNFPVRRSTPSAVPNFPPRLSTPLDGTIKLNTDAIWKCSTKLGAFGWVARNAAGVALRAACSNPSLMLSDLTGEAEAIRSALYAAREAGWGQIIVESSYKPLVSMIKGSFDPDPTVSCIVAEIKVLCTSFGSISFSVLPMALNTAAHLLAHHAFMLDEPHTWFEMPDWLIDVLAKDLV